MLLLSTNQSIILADDDSKVIEATNTMLNMFEFKDKESPNWLKRTSFDLKVEKGFKPRYDFETIQPLKQFSQNDMLFMQIHASLKDDTRTYNAGLGYRNVINPQLMLGFNTFYDYQATNKHKRWSAGVEAINQHIEFRSNLYKAITDKRSVGSNEYERALDGYDMEIGGLIPTTNLKVFASYAQWDCKDIKDLKEKNIRVEYPLTDFMTFEAKYTDDNTENQAYDDRRLSAKLTIALGKRTKEAKNLFYSQDLTQRLLIPVKRENEIVVEKTISAKITVARGS